MRICVLAEDQMRSEFLQKGVPGEIEIIWADTVKVMYSVSDIDVYFDLLFHPDRERMSALSKITDKPVFINAVNQTLNETGGSFIRINAWPTMLNRAITELAIRNLAQEEIIASVFKELQWQYLIVPDIPGMITPRVIAMIVNEAYFALEQNVSTKEEIDIAMKLGTNYPLGPFEWSGKIGLGNIYSLLHELSLTNERYRPSELLRTEASGEVNVEYRV
jgi:3-hydroxybutyryl-CoA dehydrogenase